MKFRNMLLTVALVLLPVALGGCDDAKIASNNLSRAADMFEVNRRVVFINGITDKYLLIVEGLCSIEKDNRDNQLEVICKTGPKSYKKHFLGISDNVTYVAEQIEPSKVDAHHYRVIFKPSAIVPNVELR